jgi:hypothetical protein
MVHLLGVKLEIRLIFEVNIRFFVCGSEFRARWHVWMNVRLENKKSTPWLFCGRRKIAKIHFSNSSHGKSMMQQASIEIL